MKGVKLKFYNALPKDFNRQGYLAVAKELDIKDKTAEGYNTEFLKKRLIHRESHDHYLNLTVEATTNPEKSENTKTQDSQEIKDQ